MKRKSKRVRSRASPASRKALEREHLETYLTYALLGAIILAALYYSAATFGESATGKAYSVIIGGKFIVSDAQVDLTPGTTTSIGFVFPQSPDSLSISLDGSAQNLELAMLNEPIFAAPGTLSGSRVTLNSFDRGFGDGSEFIGPRELTFTVPRDAIPTVTFDIDYAGERETQQEINTRVPVLSLRYFPLVDGHLDPDVTGMNLPLEQIRGKVDYLVASAVDGLEQGSRYRGAAPYADYDVIDEKEYLEALPRGLQYASGIYRPDYRSILNSIDICDYVDVQGVKEVWVWGYHYADIEPVETNMAMGRASQKFWNAGSYGDVSNSERSNDLPVCDNTYVLYNYNYDRTYAETLHNHGHQFEAVLRWIDSPLFWGKWVGSDNSDEIINPGCGWIHEAPNAPVDSSRSYVYDVQESRMSSCDNWQPEGGSLSPISCSDWSCGPDAQHDFIVWWMQHLPGQNNGMAYEAGGLIRNWWDFKVDFDAAIANGKSLVEFPHSDSVLIQGSKQHVGRIDATAMLGRICTDTQCTYSLGVASDGSPDDILSLSNVQITYELPAIDIAPGVRSQCASYPCTMVMSFASDTSGHVTVRGLHGDSLADAPFTLSMQQQSITVGQQALLNSEGSRFSNDLAVPVIGFIRLYLGLTNDDVEEEIASLPVNIGPGETVDLAQVFAGVDIEPGKAGEHKLTAVIDAQGQKSFAYARFTVKPAQKNEPPVEDDSDAQDDDAVGDQNSGDGGNSGDETGEESLGSGADAQEDDPDGSDKVSFSGDYDEDGIADDVDDDTDGDGIPDVEDTFNCRPDRIGKGDAAVALEGKTDDAPSQRERLLLNKGERSLVNASIDFSKLRIDCRNVVLQTQGDADMRGHTIVSGIQSEETKTVLVKQVAGMRSVCVNDAEIDNVSAITADCSGVNETFVVCDGLSRSGYTCRPVDGYLQVSGLRHSGVVEFAPPEPQAEPEPSGSSPESSPSSGSSSPAGSSGGSSGGSSSGASSSGGGVPLSGKTYSLGTLYSVRSQEVSYGDTVLFTYDGKKHNVSLRSVSPTGAIFSPSWSANTLTLDEGETREYDIDGDNEVDVKLEYASRDSTDVLVRLTALAQQPEPPAQQPAQTPEPEPVKEAGVIVGNEPAQSGFGIGWIASVVVMMLAIVVAVIVGRELRRRKPAIKSEPHEELSEYVSAQLRRGYTAQQLRSVLLDAGWTADVVNKVLSRK